MDRSVSIIIPTFNRAHLILQTLESIKKQTHTDWECLIIDDGSTDDTQKVLQDYMADDPRFRYHLRPQTLKKGPNSCRNYGFSLSKGQYVKWFDSDDILLPEALARQVSLFDEKTDAVVSKLQLFDFEKEKIIRESEIRSQKTIEDYFTGKIAFYISGALWRKEFLMRQPLWFDEEISNLDDWDFNLRMLYGNPAIVYDENVIIRYRIHPESLSQEINKLNFDEIVSEIKAREKHLHLLKKQRYVAISAVKKYTKDRYKNILRASLLQKSRYTGYFLQILLKKQLGLSDFGGMIKTIAGYSFYKLFKKGYKLLS